MRNLVVTPSYRKDFERCRNMLKSAETFVNDTSEHLLIVPAKDMKQFSVLERKGVRLVSTNSLLPEPLWQIPFQNRWWLNRQLFPLRGWILQQILKLSAAAQSHADAVIFVDSDVQFVRPLPLNSLWKNECLRLYRKPMGPNQLKCKRHQNWFRFAQHSLGLDADQQPGSFISQLTAMRPAIVRDILNVLENRFKTPWYKTLMQTLDLSEFILYGQYVQQHGCAQSKHFFSDQEICHSSWHYKINDIEDIEQFVRQTQPHHKAIHLQSNLKFASKALNQALAISS